MDYAKELLSGSSERAQQAPRQPPSNADTVVDGLLGGKTDYASSLLGAPEVTTTPGGAAVSIAGRAGMSPRQAGREGYGLDDVMKQVANADASSGPTVANYSTLVKAAHVDDPATKLRIFAEARFPGDQSAVDRYGMLGNEVVYVGDDGKLYRDTPAGFTGGAKEFTATLAGKALPIAGGAAGGFVAGGPVGTVAGAALGAFGGEGVRKIVGGLALDEPQTTGGNLKAMAAEGAWGAAGAFGGKLFGDWLNRNAAKDIARLDRPAAHQMQANARKFGFDLTPGQATNLPSQRLQEEALARMPASSDIMEEALKRQAAQAHTAAERVLAKISPVDGLDEAGTMARDAAKKVIAKLTAERSEAARPIYNYAFTSFAGFSDEQLEALARLRTSPSFKDAERTATRLIQDDLATMGAKEMPKAGALRDLHYTKLALDKMIGDTVTGAYAKTTRGALVGIKNQLLKVMDEASPPYAKARETFAHLSPNIESVSDGIISRVAGLGDEQAMTAARLMLGPQMSPAAVQRARTLFEKAGLSADWDALVRAHLQETFQKAGREFKSGGGMVGQAPAWRAALWGDPAQKRVLESAMSPAHRDSLNELMEVFEAIGRIRPAQANSITMPMQETTRAIYADSGAGVIGNAAKLLSPQEIGSRISAFLAEARAGAHAEKLARIVTSPEGMKQLRALRELPPGSHRFMIQASGTFGISIAPPKTDVQNQ